MSKAKNFSFGIILVLAILITFFTTKYTTSKQESFKCGKEDPHPFEAPKNVSFVYRLPTSIMPLNYDLKIQPFLNPNQLYFNGSVSILVSCKESTDFIQLNANELELNKQQITVSNLNETQLKLTTIEFKNEVLTIYLDKELVKNQNYTIHIPFKGNLTTSLSGFYRSSYTDATTNGEIR